MFTYEIKFKEVGSIGVGTTSYTTYKSPSDLTEQDIIDFFGLNDTNEVEWYEIELINE